MESNVAKGKLGRDTPEYFVAFCVACLVALAITNRRADPGNIVVGVASGSALAFLVERLAPVWCDRIGWFVLGIINVAIGVAAALL